MSGQVKIVTIEGTRPELIRLSEIIKKLDQYTEHILVHTNQSYDYELSQVFFDELKIRKPDYVLDVKSETVGEQIGKILTQTEQVLLKEKPDAVVILGDTNSALSCIIAKRMKIPIFHLEAGNRCFDDRVPEEINRRIIDHTCEINLCYTEHGRRNLLREGKNPQNIFVVGSPLPEVYAVHREAIAKSIILGELKLENGKYILASIHREENVLNENNLRSIMQALGMLAGEYGLPIIFSTHPRTRKQLEKFGFQLKKYSIQSVERILFCNPFGLFDYVRLQKSAFICLSDSGTIHEDSAILGLPAVHIRESNERPEAYDAGNIVMSGVETDNIINSVRLVRGQVDSGVKFSNPYGNETNFSDKVVRLIMGLHKIVAKKEYYL